MSRTEYGWGKEYLMRLERQTGVRMHRAYTGHVVDMRFILRPVGRFWCVSGRESMMGFTLW